MRDYSVFREIMKRYAQQGEMGVDPNALQLGQSVYDEYDEEYVVVTDDPATTNKVLMPKDQTGAPAGGVPQGVVTVEDADLQSGYTVQPSGAQGATTAAVKPLPEFDHTKKGFDESTDGFRIGEGGYMEILDEIQKLVDEGYGVVDIMLSIGEKFDRNRAQMVLDEARNQGIL